MNRYKRKLLKRNAKVLRLVIALYGVALLRLRPSIANFSEVMAEVGLRGRRALNTAQGSALIRAVISEVDVIGGELAGTLGQAIPIEFGHFREDFADQMKVLLPTADRAWFASNLRYATDRQIRAMAGYLAEDGALFGSLTRGYGRRMADKIIGSLITGYVGGRSPKETGALIARKLGIALNDSMNIARTATLWSYRAAAHANYLMNGHVLKGWLWSSALDERTCMSCINLHGSFHPLTEILNDHHQGRCSPEPVTKSCEELGLPCGYESPPVQRGEDWFEGLTSAAQLAMMGPGIYDAWGNGEFDFEDLSVTYSDPIWGPMQRQATLKELTNAN